MDGGESSAVPYIFLRKLPLRGGYCHHIRSDCRNENGPLIFDPEIQDPTFTHP